MVVYEHRSVFFVVRISDVTSEIQNSDVTFNVVCELPQPVGKTKFSSTIKQEQTLSQQRNLWVILETE